MDSYTVPAIFDSKELESEPPYWLKKLRYTHVERERERDYIWTNLTLLVERADEIEAGTKILLVPWNTKSIYYII